MKSQTQDLDNEIIASVTTQPLPQEVKTPQSYAEAISGPDAAMWKQSMQKEIDAHKKNSTWLEVP